MIYKSDWISLTGRSGVEKSGKCLRRVSVGSIIHAGICLAADQEEEREEEEEEEGPAQPVDRLTLGAFCGHVRETTHASAPAEASDLLRERRMDGTRVEGRACVVCECVIIPQRTGAGAASSSKSMLWQT